MSYIYAECQYNKQLLKFGVIKYESFLKYSKLNFALKTGEIFILFILIVHCMLKKD